MPLPELCDVDEQLSLTLQPLEGTNCREPIRLEKLGVIVAGRSSSAHLHLPKDDKRHSRLHFVIEFNPPFCRVLDLGSRNGTLVNGQRVFSGELCDGDVLTAGGTSFRVRLEGSGFIQNESKDSHVGRADSPVGLASSPAAEEVSHWQAGTPAPRDEGSDDDLAFEVFDEERDQNATQIIRNHPANGKPAAANHEAEKARSATKQKSAEQLQRLSRQPQSKEFDIDALLAAESSLVDKPLAMPEFVDVPDGAIVIPGYELLRSVGKGRIGEVFHAQREEDGREVAVKVLQSPKAVDKTAVEAFLAEVQPLLKIDHPNIVKYHAFVCARLRIRGDGLYRRHRRRAARAQRRNDGRGGRVAKLASQLLLGLDHAHGLGLVHRDIKPSNILITEGNSREVCLLSNFGLARAFQNSPLFGVKMKADLERSVRFMAPEQFMNFKETPRSADIYSIAATLYYLLTTKYVHDYESLSFDQSVNALKRDEAIPLVRRRFDVPPEMATLIHQALSRFPQKRIACAATFRKEIYKFIR